MYVGTLAPVRPLEGIVVGAGLPQRSLSGSPDVIFRAAPCEFEQKEDARCKHQRHQYDGSEHRPQLIIRAIHLIFHGSSFTRRGRGFACFC